MQLLIKGCKSLSKVLVKPDEFEFNWIPPLPPRGSPRYFFEKCSSGDLTTTGKWVGRWFLTAIFLSVTFSFIYMCLQVIDWTNVFSTISTVSELERYDEMPNQLCKNSKQLFSVYGLGFCYRPSSPRLKDVKLVIISGEKSAFDVFCCFITGICVFFGWNTYSWHGHNLVLFQNKAAWDSLN